MSHSPTSDINLNSILSLPDADADTPPSPASTHKMVMLGRGNEARLRPMTTTPLSSSATGSTSVNKIDVSYDRSAKVGGASPGRTIPVDDLNMLVSSSKTKVLSEPLSTIEPAVPFTIQRTPSTPVFESLGNLAPSPRTFSESATAAPASSFVGSSPLGSKLLDETTDLSDLLKQPPKGIPFTPSINVSKTIDTVGAGSNATGVGGSTLSASRSLFGSPSPAGASAAAAPVSPTAAVSPAAPAPAPSKGIFASLFGGANNAAAPPPTPTASSSLPQAPVAAPSRPMTDAEIQKEKQDLLFKLNRLQQRGMPISRKYTMSSPLDDIKTEFTSLKTQRDIQASVKFQRKMMMAVVTGVEFLNTKFDPFDVKLDGWSESVHENVTDYDEIFEELHEKYKEKAKMAPETKLFFSLAGSAFMFHLTQSLFKTGGGGLGGMLGGGMGDVLQQNPEMMKQFAQAAVGAQQRQMGGAAPRAPGVAPPTPHNAQSAQMGSGGGLGGMLGGLLGGGGGGGGIGDMVGGLMGMGSNESGSDAGSSYGASEVKRHQMSGPSGVEDILSQLAGGGDRAGGASRIASVTKAEESDVAQLGQRMRGMDTASSGYRRNVNEGIRLNL